MRTELNLMIAMPDGTRLATDLCYPDGDGPFPALIARTPYGKSHRPEIVERFVENGYAVVMQDVRGRYASEGRFYPYIHETGDGIALMEWVRAQSWCDGNIGTFGGSYLGGTQWLPARKGPEGLRAMIPEVTFDNTYEGTCYQSGAKVMHDLRWTVADIIPDAMRRAAEAGDAMAADGTALSDASEALHEGRDLQDGMTLRDGMALRNGMMLRNDMVLRDDMALPDVNDALSALPIADHPLIRRYGAFYHDWLEHDTPSDFWRQTAPNAGYTGVTVPALNISGWYDIFVPSTLRNYMNMKKQGGSALSRSWQRLIMGPWTHMNFTGVFPERSYGPAADAREMGLDRIKTAWFDRWTKGDESALQLTGDPVGGQVILPGENAMGPRDQREVERRDDVLVYSTPILETAVEVTGPIVLRLFASVDAPDTDFTAKLVDVFPYGRAFLLTDGILRARYRNGTDHPELLAPGRTYAFEIDMGATSNMFLPGHRIRLEIAGSNFPKFNRNSNSGGTIAREGAESYRAAKITVRHDAECPSQLILPLIERA